MSAIKCCYRCSDRQLGCHGKCDKYREEKKEHERLKEIEKKARDREAALNSYNYRRGQT